MTQSIILQKLKYIFFGTTFSILVSTVSAQTPRNLKVWPEQVEANLNRAGKNRSELEKLLAYYKKDKDTLKLKAAIFLIANMDIHYSESYYWADSTGKKADFDELSFKDFESARTALDALKATKSLHAVPMINWDLDQIKGAFLIQQIELAFKAWRANTFHKLDFRDFCEYILPYRVTSEPLQDWRDIYKKTYKAITDSLVGKLPSKEVLAHFGDQNYRDFHFIIKNAPFTLRGGLQLLFRNEGECDDAATMEAFALRSQGIPASYNIIPYWATTGGRHFVCTAFNEQMSPLPLYSPIKGQTGVTLPREPAKVLRVTYSKNPENLAAKVKYEDIPPGVMQTLNYVDVTGEYWPVSEVKCQIWKSDSAKSVYAAIFSRGAWHAVWWATPKTGFATFSQMPQGVVILPVLYQQGHLVPIGYPQTNMVKENQTLVPNEQQKQVVRIKQQDRYLIFRPEKKYSLYYWNKSWIKAGEQVAKTGAKELVYDQVPSNALYLLIPEYSIGLERPFTISSDGNRNWY